jgi:hypothetical protein
MELWKIRMKTTSAGPEKCMLAGKEYDVSREEAELLIPVYADLIWKPEEKTGNQANQEGNTGESFPKFLSPGRWELSDGSIFQGKKTAAIEAENALKG